MISPFFPKHELLCWLHPFINDYFIILFLLIDHICFLEKLSQGAKNISWEIALWQLDLCFIHYLSMNFNMNWKQHWLTKISWNQLSPMFFYMNNLPSLSNVKTLLISCFWHISLLLDALDNHIVAWLLFQWWIKSKVQSIIEACGLMG
jgi:hypothetical protein